ncbi:MAG: PaaI family thioesterase [Myxococcales bacterium]|nr:PaaI family thioesterase [Sorangiineae bacterium PRO1]MCL4749896.1 PaaI family thioesterase [Myxococcales bacterium]
MDPKDPNWRERADQIFSRANFVRELGIRLCDLGPGWVETELAVEPRHMQQDGVVHAGVLATLADHSAGAAAGTLAPDGHATLSVEFKIQLLRPALGERLRCRAEVIRPGRSIVATEARVWAVAAGGEEKLVSLLTATMTYVRL